VTENLSGLAWIAEIQKGGSRYVTMLSVPLPAAAAEKNAMPLVLQVQPVFEQKQPILDLIRRDDLLAVLDPGSISVFRWSEGWQIRRTAPLMHQRPWPRDLRGRLVVEGSSLRAYLPGSVCRGDLELAALECRDADEAWPLDFPEAKPAGGRNYFQAAGLPPFFAAARAGSPGDPRWLLAGLDGKAYLYGSSREVLATFEGWGSDVAALRTGCDDGVQVLAVLAGESGSGDSIQLFKIAHDRPAPVSLPAQLPGRITALWPAPGGAVVTLVCHNPQANRYEAYQVSVSCGR
jgi:hypothetical protein